MERPRKLKTNPVHEYISGEELARERMCRDTRTYGDGRVGGRGWAGGREGERDSRMRQGDTRDSREWTTAQWRQLQLISRHFISRRRESPAIEERGKETG